MAVLQGEALSKLKRIAGKIYDKRSIWIDEIIEMPGIPPIKGSQERINYIVEQHAERIKRYLQDNGFTFIDIKDNPEALKYFINTVPFESSSMPLAYQKGLSEMNLARSTPIPPVVSQAKPASPPGTAMESNELDAAKHIFDYLPHMLRAARDIASVYNGFDTFTNDEKKMLVYRELIKLINDDLNESTTLQKIIDHPAANHYLSQSEHWDHIKKINDHMEKRKQEKKAAAGIPSSLSTEEAEQIKTRAIQDANQGIGIQSMVEVRGIEEASARKGQIIKVLLDNRQNGLVADDRGREKHDAALLLKQWSDDALAYYEKCLAEERVKLGIGPAVEIRSAESQAAPAESKPAENPQAKSSEAQGGNGSEKHEEKAIRVAHYLATAYDALWIQAAKGDKSKGEPPLNALDRSSEILVKRFAKLIKNELDKENVSVQEIIAFGKSLPAHSSSRPPLVSGRLFLAFSIIEAAQKPSAAEAFRMPEQKPTYDPNPQKNFKR